MIQADRVHARFSVLIFAATILLFLPTWLWLADAWLSDPYYSHGPLVLLVALYFVVARRKVLSESASAPNTVGLIVDLDRDPAQGALTVRLHVPVVSTD